MFEISATLSDELPLFCAICGGIVRYRTFWGISPLAFNYQGCSRWSNYKCLWLCLKLSFLFSWNSKLQSYFVISECPSFKITNLKKEIDTVRTLTDRSRESINISTQIFFILLIGFEPEIVYYLNLKKLLMFNIT